MTEEYPAFQKWYKLLDWILDKCEGYPKSVRFTFSGRIANISLDVLERLIEAIYTKKRSHILGTINLYIEKLRVLFRLSFERGYISGAQFEYIAAQIDDFGRMIGGWNKVCDE
jgi:hypothetical protein